VTEKTATQFEKDVAALGCLQPSVEPRATEHIAGMIAIIERLIAKGHAYEAGGEVLFRVASMADYGKLSGRNLEDNIAGARVAVESHKENPADFVLWKASNDDEPGWDSPWGRGRPGWHIECSAMSEAFLGETFDIHGGGLDLIFPHHENEIAQSRCAHGTDVMANYWMHNGYLQLEGWQRAARAGKETAPDAATIAELADDLNFSRASMVLDAMARKANRGTVTAAHCLAVTLEFFGFSTDSLLKNSAGDSFGIEDQIDARLGALAAKDFAMADAIRNKLLEDGIQLMDYK
ncbi:cysS, partial [Symbiodinium sp. CCMP2456]